MKCVCAILFAIVAFGGLQNSARADTILLTSGNFAVLGASTVTNTGATTIVGNLGVYPGTALTGSGTITLTGTTHLGDAVAQQAQVDATTAYNGLAAMSPTSNLSGQDLGGLTLTSGVYKFNTSAQLTGTLTLDAQGLNNAYWVFQIGSTLTTASAAVVTIINPGSNGGSDDGLFWQVGSSATLGTSTAFEGNILADQSITLNTGAIIDNGRALALNAAVTMDNNTISIPSPAPNFGPGLSGGLEYDGGGSIVPIGPSEGTGTGTGTGTATASGTATATATATGTATATATTGIIVIGVGVPEPTAVGLWALLGLTLGAFRKWKKARS